MIFLASVSIQIAMAQCFPDKHNTTWYDEWISCEASLNPNSSYGLSHWIMYDFNREAEIRSMHIWNSNVPGHLDIGFKSVAIDYSSDGEEWNELGTYTFEQATGLNIYEGFDLEEFDSFKARYLLLTALSNYGGNCYGISEIRFETDSASNAIDENSAENGCFAAIIYPNPFRQTTNMKVTVNCKEKTVWFVTDSYGKVVSPAKAISTTGQHDIIIDGSGWSAGIYYLTIKQKEKVKQYKLVKLGAK